MLGSSALDSTSGVTGLRAVHLDSIVSASATGINYKSDISSAWSGSVQRFKQMVKYPTIYSGIRGSGQAEGQRMDSIYICPKPTGYPQVVLLGGVDKVQAGVDKCLYQ